MVVGKTISSTTVKDLIKKYGEISILSSVFTQINCLPCLICSPLRRDTKPSFSIYLDNTNHVRFKDFADGSSGGLLDLLCAYWKCSLAEAITKAEAALEKRRNIEAKPTAIKICTQKEHSQNTNIQVTIRNWRKYDYDYWESYGVSKEALKYAEVYPISHKIVTKIVDGKHVKRTFLADKYAYCFVERKEGKTSLKIYQPFNTQGYKWCSKMDGSVIGLWSKIPESGDRVIICSSLKDALCIYSQLGIPTLCLQGEGYGISDTAIKELKRRYKKIFISFDTDAPGMEDSNKLAEKTGFVNIIPDLGAQKDYSDYYKSLDNKNDFQKLKTLFNGKEDKCLGIGCIPNGSSEKRLSECQKNDCLQRQAHTKD